jgi:phenylacetate-coenzyme A ligase PaaK-like adenylate-forming protein
MEIAKILDIQPYSLNRTEKEKLFGSFLTELSRYHYTHCADYRKMMDSIGFDLKKNYAPWELPFLPVQLFKTRKLQSIPKEEIVKTLSSSGTSGQAKSNVFLDKDNAANQTKALTKIVSSFIGTKRLPLIIIDSEEITNERNRLSAFAAGVVGFSLFGHKKIFALNEQMELDHERLLAFIKQHAGERILLFGATFKVYRHFCEELEKSGTRPDLSNAVLIHGGGWKKLEKEAVSEKRFREKLTELCGIQDVHDYYGMVEQTGSIYMECQFGHYHASVFSDIVIRRALDFSIADTGEEGIIQVLSLLPKSYPGHSLLTDDKGILLGEDDCTCGRLGKYFTMTGRLTNSEIRGCSDTYEESVN